jgi:cytidine deaminase
MTAPDQLFTLLRSAELDSTSLRLLEEAELVLKNAYAPYSRFHVATAILLDDQSIVTGTNQENAAYPSGMCAERVAFFTIASQHPGKKIKKVLVLAKVYGATVSTPATSCGPCRQVMLEFEHRQQESFEVIMQTKQGLWVVAHSAKALLPFSFSPEDLQVRK